MTKTTIALDDKQRLEEFLRLLPEKGFNAYLDELREAVMRPNHSLSVVPAINASKEIFSQFSSDVLNKKYLLFIEALNCMRIFVGNNFSIGDGTQCYELLSGRDNLEDKAQLKVWDEKYIELCAWVANAKEKYDDFLKTARIVLSPKGSDRASVPSTGDKVPSKIAISFESRRGFYLTDNPTLCYAIGPITKRLRLIKLLNKAIGSVPISTIKSEIKYKSKIKQNANALVIKEIKGINKLFKEKLRVSEDFIISNESGGYSLNREKFTVQNL